MVEERGRARTRSVAAREGEAGRDVEEAAVAAPTDRAEPLVTPVPEAANVLEPGSAVAQPATGGIVGSIARMFSVTPGSQSRSAAVASASQAASPAAPPAEEPDVEEFGDALPEPEEEGPAGADAEQTAITAQLQLASVLEAQRAALATQQEQILALRDELQSLRTSRSGPRVGGASIGDHVTAAPRYGIVSRSSRTGRRRSGSGGIETPVLAQAEFYPGEVPLEDEAFDAFNPALQASRGSVPLSGFEGSAGASHVDMGAVRGPAPTFVVNAVLASLYPWYMLRPYLAPGPRDMNQVFQYQRSLSVALAQFLLTLPLLLHGQRSVDLFSLDQDLERAISNAQVGHHLVVPYAYLCLHGFSYMTQQFDDKERRTRSQNQPIQDRWLGTNPQSYELVSIISGRRE